MAASDGRAVIETLSAPETTGGSWIVRRTVPAWLLSVALHCTTFTVLGLVVQDTPRGIAGVEPSREGGIVLVHRSAAKTEYLSDEEPGGAPQASAAAGSNAPVSSFPELIEPLLNDGPQLPTGGGLIVSELPPSAAVPGTTGMTGSGSGLGRRGKGGNYDVETRVFGVSGRGSRFVYVFDRSASMAGYEGRPLASAKRELVASLQSLGKVHQFQIIFYNEHPHLMKSRGEDAAQMFFGDEQGKRLAEEFVRGVVADGGTGHLAALQMALQMNPDVVFFLTDADEPKLSASELQQISRWNKGTTINAIEFGSGPSAGQDNFLRRIAEQNDGQYRYVDVTTLPRG